MYASCGTSSSVVEGVFAALPSTKLITSPSPKSNETILNSRYLCKECSGDLVDVRMEGCGCVAHVVRIVRLLQMLRSSLFPSLSVFDAPRAWWRRCWAISFAHG